jgi:hypothetical protein
MVGKKSMVDPKKYLKTWETRSLEKKPEERKEEESKKRIKKLLHFPHISAMHCNFDNIEWKHVLPFSTTIEVRVMHNCYLGSSIHGHVLILIELVLIKNKRAKICALNSCNSGYVVILVLYVVYLTRYQAFLNDAINQNAHCEQMHCMVQSLQEQSSTDDSPLISVEKHWSLQSIPYSTGLCNACHAISLDTTFVCYPISEFCCCATKGWLTGTCMFEWISW